MKRVTSRARAGFSEQTARATLTMMDMSESGVEEFCTTVTPPETAVLAVGTLREQIIVEQGAMRPGLVMTMTLSADRRIVDGITGAKFLSALRAKLEA